MECFWRAMSVLGVVRGLMFAVLGVAALPIGEAGAQSAAAPQRSVTQGLAKTVVQNLYPCPEKVSGHRGTPVGVITATDGTTWTTPAETALQKGIGPKSGDLFNACNRVTPKDTSEVSTASVPIIEVDADGEVITGYIVADNYFELYVNGKLVAVDPVPYTPSNGSIVKFRAKRPITYAFYLVDWEEDLGVGTEAAAGPRGGYRWHMGDGGVIAKFSDGTVTDSSWKAQSFYIAPLANPSDVVEKGNVHDTSKYGRVHPHAVNPGCEDRCYAVRYPIPANWMTPAFDDSRWPNAYEYTDEEVGVNAVPGYTRFTDLYTGSRWIWSINLVFDNLVLARKTVR